MSHPQNDKPEKVFWVSVRHKSNRQHNSDVCLVTKISIPLLFLEKRRKGEQCSRECLVLVQLLDGRPSCKPGQ